MIDLHTHSIFSDGTNTPEELVSFAEQAGLSALALTDHDTTAGLERFFAAAEKTTVQAISGIELSTEFGERPLHILGYGFDPSNVVLQERLVWVREGRAERNVKILAKLNALGYALTMDDVRKHSSDDLVGRPHFALALLETGRFKQKNKIFQQLLGKNCAAYVDRKRLTPSECIELIQGAGGIAVIAHPGQLKITRNKLRRLMKKLKEQGLGGLEVWHPSHPPHQIDAFQRLCEEFDLVATGGTDFHGSFTPDLKVGVGFGSLEVLDEVLENLSLSALH